MANVPRLRPAWVIEGAKGTGLSRTQVETLHELWKRHHKYAHNHPTRIVPVRRPYRRMRATLRALEDAHLITSIGGYGRDKFALTNEGHETARRLLWQIPGEPQRTSADTKTPGA